MFKLIGNLLSFVFAITVMPALIVFLILAPVAEWLYATDMIRMGYGNFIGIGFVVLLLFFFCVYISLRFKFARKVYFALPFLYETVKYLLIVNVFWAIAYEGLCRAYTKHILSRQAAGICFFIGTLIAWRIFMYLYYRKRKFEPLEEVVYVDEGNSAC